MVFMIICFFLLGSCGHEIRVGLKRLERERMCEDEGHDIFVRRIDFLGEFMCFY